MTFTESLLTKAKLILNLDNSYDALLTLLIEEATEEAKNYTHNENIEVLSSAIVHMACYKYEVRGSESLEGESFSGVSLNYSTDYPEPIMRELKAKRKAILV